MYLLATKAIKIQKKSLLQNEFSDYYRKIRLKELIDPGKKFEMERPHDAKFANH